MLIELADKNLFFWSPESLKFFRKAPQSYAVSADEFLFLENGNVYSLDRASSTLELIFTDLHNFPDPKLFPTRSAGLLGLSGKRLFQLTPQLRRLPGESIETVTWHEQSKTLLYASPNEIWFDKANLGGGPEIIVRASDALKKPVYADALQQIVFLQDSKIKAVELYGPAPRNITTLVESETPITDFLLDPQARIIYFLQANGDLLSKKIR